MAHQYILVVQYPEYALPMNCAYGSSYRILRQLARKHYDSRYRWKIIKYNCFYFKPPAKLKWIGCN